ncbi:MAG: Ku protein [Mucilaginibacter polytrichastri]|nr:Ku protein [Mucilaginibacter polytrichastri]
MKSIWKGSISFGLVTIPIKLYSAVEDSKLDLDMLDSRDHAHIRYKRVNEHTQKEVPYEKIVKGYKLKDDYIILEDQDFEDAAPEKSKTIDIESFVKFSEINPMLFQTSYYVEPDASGRKPYALLLAALKKSKLAGLARFVLRSTENLCIVHPIDNVIVLTRIRFEQQIRPVDELVKPQNAGPSKKEMDVAMALIKQYTEKFDISKFKDEYTSELVKIIKAKAKGKRPTIKKLKPKKAKSDDLYDQLMESLKTRKGA